MKKNKKILLFIIINLFSFKNSSPNFSNTKNNANKHVIGCLSYTGFFSNFFAVLNHLSWAEKNNKIPVVFWASNCLYYQQENYNNQNNKNINNNCWEYYFYPVSNLACDQSDKSNNEYWAPDKSGIDYRFDFGLSMFKYIKWANNLINKYIKLKPEIINKFQDFYQKNIAGKPTVAIHIRGTDKAKETGQISPEILFEEANKYSGYQFFVTSDEQKYIDQAKKSLKNNVIYYDAIRSTNGEPIHLKSTSNKALLGEQVLIEILLAASCNHFIHTLSNVSTAAYFFNPNLSGTVFNPWGQKFLISPKR